MTTKKTTTRTTTTTAAKKPTATRKPTVAKSTAATVPAFMAALEHPLKPAIELVRQTVLSAHPALGEQIKWNAPSFGIDGDDRVTFRVLPTTLQLIFHRGVAVKSTAGFQFDDDTGLIAWITPDRGVATFNDAQQIASALPALTTLVHRWVETTKQPLDS